MTARRKILYLPLAIVAALALALGGVVARQASKVGEIFAANETLKSEGYDLSAFEFELLSAMYFIDHGQYLRGLRRLDAIHDKYVDRKGLVKIPDFASPEEKLEFYLDRQNPETGAFYPNGTDPLFAYVGVTANMINFIEVLSRNAGRPFALKYPLRFLDDISTPDKVTAMLDDVSRVGWIGARFKPPFVSAIELNDLIGQDEHLGIHGFTDAWKHAFYQWFYDNQNPDTGLWGARDRASGAMLGGGDVGDSGKIIKMFVDNEGNDLRPDEFPLRHVDRIFATSMDQLADPMPARPDEQHRWILDRDRGFRFLTRYLWPRLSVDDRRRARALMEKFVRVRFERYFVASDGAFSLYPDADHADLDGTGEALGMLDYTGALAPEKQTRLWGAPAETIIDLGRRVVPFLAPRDLNLIARRKTVKSLRFYRADPGGDFVGNAAAILYPSETPVLDLVDLAPRLTHWLETTPQSMGNWVNRDATLAKLSDAGIAAAPGIGENPLDEIARLLKENGELFVVGFDTLQVPRFRVVFEAI
ncbi:MAG: hypothetical protein K9H11_11380 [Rhodospirillum sp.]|nr:hypothetical protein [Rhodospirillum sp.]